MLCESGIVGVNSKTLWHKINYLLTLLKLHIGMSISHIDHGGIHFLLVEKYNDKVVWTYIIWLDVSFEYIENLKLPKIKWTKQAVSKNTIIFS